MEKGRDGTTGNTEKLGAGRTEISLARLGWVFLKIGLTAFGG